MLGAQQVELSWTFDDGSSLSEREYEKIEMPVTNVYESRGSYSDERKMSITTFYIDSETGIMTADVRAFEKWSSSVNETVFSHTEERDRAWNE